MRLLDRYLFREILRPTLLGIGLYTFVLFMNQFFLLARLAIQKGLSSGALLELITLQVPRIALLTVPMGILLGVLIGLGRLSADSEIVALRAGGVSYLRLGRPILLLGCGGLAVGLILYHFLTPRAHLEEARLRNQFVVQTDLNREIKPRVFYDDVPGFVLYADQVDHSDPEWPLRSVFARMEQPGGQPERILVCRKARVERDAGSGLLIFRSDQGEVHIFDPAQPQDYRVVRFAQPYQEGFQPPGFGPAPGEEYRRGVQDLSTPELTELIHRRGQRADSGGAAIDDIMYRKAWVERDQRYAVPFAAIAFGLLGLPLGLVTRRGGRAAGFAVSLPVIILYWLAFTVGRDLATDGKIPLPLGAWSANILLLALGGALIFVRQRFETFSSIDATVAPLRAVARRLPGLRGGVGAGDPDPAPTSVVSPPSAYSLRVSPPPGCSSRPRPPATAPDTAAGSPGLAERLGIRAPILDRYICSLYLRVLGLVVLSVYTIVWVVVSRNILDSLADEHLPPSALFEYIAYYTPGAAWYVLPISAVVAGLTAIGILERNNEGIAMRAAGMSVYRVAVPVLAATLLVCGLYYLVQDYVAPASNQEAMRLEDQMQGRSGTVAPGIRWIFGRDGRLYGYRDYDPTARSFQGLTVLELARKGQAVKRRIWADRAFWSGAGWKVASGWQWEWKDEALVGYRAMAGETMRFPEGPEFFNRREESFLKGSRLPDQMSISELREHLKLTGRSGYDTTHLKVALFSKTAFPFTPLVMVLIGLPFAFRMGRKGSLYGIGIALGLVIVYWAVFAVFNALGLEGVVPPPLSAWAPNLLFALSGTYLLLSVRS